MPVSILALKRGTADVTIPVGAETLKVTYRPGVITPGFTDKCWFDLPTWIAAVVERWDLEDDDGKVVPLQTEEGDPTLELRALPTDFLALVQREINKDLLPGKRLRATSTAG